MISSQDHGGCCLSYLNNRYHDPQTGTFLSVDPLVAVTGQAYLYGNGNPVTYSDPTGLEPCPKKGCSASDSGGREVPVGPPRHVTVPKPPTPAERVKHVMTVEDLAVAEHLGLVQRYELPRVPNLMTVVDAHARDRTSRTTGSLSAVEELLGLVGAKGLGISIDEPVTKVYRINGSMSEFYIEGVDEFRPLAVVGGVDAFVVEISQDSGIGIDVGPRGAEADPTQSYGGDPLPALASSRSTEIAVYIVSTGRRWDLVEHPVDAFYSARPVQTWAVRSW